jgi:hypothetical protein
VKLVWHADNLLEVDWLRHVFGDLIEEECTDLKLTCFDDHSIHVVSSNWQPLPTYEEYFRERRARCSHLVLFHASDEWFFGRLSTIPAFRRGHSEFRDRSGQTRGHLDDTGRLRQRHENGLKWTPDLGPGIAEIKV